MNQALRRASATLLLIVGVLLASTPRWAAAFGAGVRTGAVTDPAHSLTPAQAAELEAVLTDHQRRFGHDVAVFLPTSLQGDSIETAAQHTFDQWGVGESGERNGVLLIIAKRERRVRLHVGAKLRTAISDAQAEAILREQITPRMKVGKTYEAVKGGVGEVLVMLRKAPPPPPGPAPVIVPAPEETQTAPADTSASPAAAIGSVFCVGAAIAAFTSVGPVFILLYHRRRERRARFAGSAYNVPSGPPRPPAQSPPSQAGGFFGPGSHHGGGLFGHRGHHHRGGFFGGGSSGGGFFGSGGSSGGDAGSSGGQGGGSGTSGGWGGGGSSGADDGGGGGDYGGGSGDAGGGGASGGWGGGGDDGGSGGSGDGGASGGW